MSFSCFLILSADRVGFTAFAHDLEAIRRLHAPLCSSIPQSHNPAAFPDPGARTPSANQPTIGDSAPPRRSPGTSSKFGDQATYQRAAIPFLNLNRFPSTNAAQLATGLCLLFFFFCANGTLLPPLLDSLFFFYFLPGVYCRERRGEKKQRVTGN